MKLFLIFLAFFSQNIWAAEYGIFMVVKGHVLIESADGKKQQDAKINSKIVEGETVIVDADSKAKIVMSDRNILNVLANTKLKIEKYSNSENDKNVSLKLIEGKLRTKVEQKYNTN